MRVMSDKKRFGLGFLLAGVIFLCNPIVSLFDFLPDFVGYLLILRGIYALADINGYLDDGRKGVKYLAISSALRTVSILFVFGLAEPREQSTLIVLVTFVFGVIDSFLLINAWKNIFGGLTYLATRHGGEAVLSQSKKGSVTDRIQHSTLFSLIFIQVMALLPELTAFTDRGVYTDLESSAPDLYGFIGLLRGTAMLISLAVGIIWAVKMFRYVKFIKADKEFFEKLDSIYASEVLSRPNIFTIREIKRGLVCMTAALALSIDFYDSALLGCNVIPDVLVAALLIVGILLMRKQVKGISIPILLCGAYGAWEIAVWISQFGFFKNSTAADIFKSHTVHGAYYRMCIVTFGGQLLFLAAVVSVILLLSRVVGEHTGVSAISDHGAQYSAERTKYIHRSLKLRLVAVGIIAFLSVAATVTYFLSLPYAFNTLWEAFWIVNMLVPAILAIVFWSFKLSLADKMEYKYQLI